MEERSHALLVVEHGTALADEVHFVKLLTVVYNDFARLVNPAVHAHDELVLEADVRVQEEVVEVQFEILEQRLTDLVLDAGGQLVVELELLDDQVVVVDKGILNEHLDRVVQVVRDLLF